MQNHPIEESSPVLAPFEDSEFNKNDKSTYFNYDIFDNKIGVKQNMKNLLIPSEIHSEIFEENILINSFKSAIEINQEFFENKEVLVINSGIGLFALFAAKAGASKVYSLEYNTTKYEYQKQIVKENHYNDIIEVLNLSVYQIHEKIKVNIIICEWMGNFLLYNSFLDEIIYARDNFIDYSKPYYIFPDKATLYISCIEDQKYKYDKFCKWENIYNINMNCLKNESLRDPIIDNINKNKIISDIKPIFLIDIYKILVLYLI